MLLFMAVSSCNSRNDRSDYLKQLDEEQAQKEANLKIAADSTVSLSFNGFTLGASFSTSVKNAIKDKRISNIKYNSDKTGLSGSANIYLTTQENPLEVELWVTSLNDSISSICITSTNYETRNDLIDLYKTKYLEKFANFEHKNGSDSYVWIFNNQSLRVANLYETEQEVYVKDSRIKSPENRYGVKSTNYFKSVVILYNDTELCERAKEIQAKEDSEKRKLNQLENERRSKNIQDRARHQDI